MLAEKTDVTSCLGQNQFYIIRNIYESTFRDFKRCINPSFLEKVMLILLSVLEERQISRQDDMKLYWSVRTTQSYIGA